MRASRTPMRDVVSAGGVVWRRASTGDIDVVLCGRIADGLWALPKGTPDIGESIEQTALREVREETGLQVVVGLRLPTIDYWFVADGVRYHKFVHHWLMEPTGGDTSGHDAEFDLVRWESAANASKLLTYPNERRVLAEAVTAIEALR